MKDQYVNFGTELRRLSKNGVAFVFRNTYTPLLPSLSTCLCEKGVLVRVGYTGITNRLKNGSNIIQVYFLIGRCSPAGGESEPRLVLPPSLRSCRHLYPTGRVHSGGVPAFLIAQK